MIVHRLLDAVFRTLDTVDAIRARVDAALTREAQPPSSWPAVIGNTRGDRTTIDVDTAREVYAPVTVDAWATAPATDVTSTPSPGADAPPAAKLTTVAAPKPAPKPAAKPAAKPALATSTKAGAKKGSKSTTKPTKLTKPTAARQKPTPPVDTRKGSVDRVGKDLDSPRANDITAWLAAHPQPIVTEDAAVDGKRAVARLLWAVSVAQQAGHNDGLTAADVSALLSSVAHIEMFATNVARAFRDERALFVEAGVDGRSKRYTMTAAGKKCLVDVAVG